MQLHTTPQNARKRRGQNSRDRILASLQHQPDQSRDQLMKSANLTYDQVRDQTQNLCVEGLILSDVGSRGERRYSLRQNCLRSLAVIVKPSTAKQMLVLIALQLGVDSESLEGKPLTAMQLMQAIADYLQDNLAFLICDDAHRLQVQVRSWLERLHELGQPLLLLATHPPARDIFLKLPRIELKPLGDRTIRQIMKEAAAELELELSTAQLAHLQQRAGGNPMLAARVIREEYLGLDDPSPDHRQWIDGTPLLIAGLMTFTILRFIGLELNSTSLYLFGGILAVAVGIFRLILYSLPASPGG